MKTPKEIVLNEYEIALIEVLKTLESAYPETYESFANLENRNGFYLAELLAIWNVFPDRSFSEIARVRTQGGVRTRLGLYNMLRMFFPRYVFREATEKFPEINDTTKPISDEFREYAKEKLFLYNTDGPLGEYWVCDVDKVKENFVEEYEIVVATKTLRRYRMRGSIAADVEEAFLNLSKEEREEFFFKEDEPIVSVDVDFPC